MVFAHILTSALVVLGLTVHQFWHVSCGMQQVPNEWPALSGVTVPCPTVIPTNNTFLCIIKFNPITTYLLSSKWKWKRLLEEEYNGTFGKRENNPKWSFISFKQAQACQNSQKRKDGNGANMEQVARIIWPCTNTLPSYLIYRMLSRFC